jgi:hypothetical protein
MQRMIVGYASLSEWEGGTIMAKVFALAILLLLAWGAESAVACWVPFVPTFSGQTANVSMTARSGRPCAIRFRSPGPTYGTQISRRPSNGTVRIGGVGHIIYTSRPGFVGSDAFSYVRSGEGARGGSSVRPVDVAVTVTP